VVIGTASVAIADDNVTPDGTEDAVFSVSAVAFGSVCPDRDVTHGLQVGLKTQGRTRPNTYANSTPVTFSVRTQIAGAQSNGWFEGPAGSFGAATLPPTPGVDAGAITTPSDWQTRGTAAAPLPPKESAKLSTQYTLHVAADAEPGTYQGTGRWFSRGAGWDSANTSTANLILPTTPESTGSTSLLGAVHNVNWTVLDGDDASCNRAPSLISATFGSASHVSCGAASLDVRVDDPDFGITSASESLTIDVDLDGDGTMDETRSGVTSSAVQTFAAPYDAGQHTAHVTVTDQHGATDSAQASITVDYGTSGILQPVNATGPISVFKAGSTIPLKIRFTNCAGGTPSDLFPTIRVTKVAGSPPVTGADEAALNTSAHTDGVMRYSDGQWIYNLSTKAPSMSDPSATYRLFITVPATGQTVQVDFGLRA
jgi:hypothetical protein